MKPETTKKVEAANALARQVYELNDEDKRYWAARSALYDQQRELETRLLAGDMTAFAAWQECERRTRAQPESPCERKWAALEAWGKANGEAVRALVEDAGLLTVKL